MAFDNYNWLSFGTHQHWVGPITIVPVVAIVGGLQCVTPVKLLIVSNVQLEPERPTEHCAHIKLVSRSVTVWSRLIV
ncbi:MAG: hypothetical protein ACJA2E_000141 [Arenicella sp.]|jgi:hypothetical protein